MTQEEKQLPIVDLCARLPNFENWVQYEGEDYIVTGYGHGRVSLLSSPFSSACGPCPLVEEIKPYLRPMSSMTGAEREELEKLKFFYYEGHITNEVYVESEFNFKPVLVDELHCSAIVDWLNTHHLDYRGLIPMGLALEALEDMYK